MPNRVVAPGSYQPLCWGQKSDSPRSKVLDLNNRMIFDSSLVVTDEGVFADVVRLVSEDLVCVRFSDGTECEVLARSLIVQIALRET